MNELEIQEQIEQLKVEYRDVKSVLETLSRDLNNTAYLRGALSGAGAAAELILKCVYRREKKVDDKIPVDRAYELKKQESEKLMLDELIRGVEAHVPLRIITHLRTIQAWRNIGSHNKGQVADTINETTLQIVSLALNELVTWFIREYLNHDLDFFNSLKEEPKQDYREVVSGNSVSIEESSVRSDDYNARNMLWKVWRNSDNGLSYGFIDKTGKVAVFPMFENFRWVDDSHETVAVEINGKWGLIDSSGKWLIQPMFDTAFWYVNGLANVYLNTKYGVIDRKGNWIIQPIFDALGEFRDGVIFAAVNEKWGIIDTQGRWLQQPIFDDFRSFYSNEGLAGVQFQNKWGYVNSSGNWMISPIFDDISSFSEGLAFVEREERWGIINTSGDWIIEPIFDYDSEFKNKRAVVAHDDKVGIINSSGNWVVPPTFDTIVRCDNGLYLACVKSKCGFIDEHGNWAIQPIFDSASIFNNELAAVSLNNKYGFINNIGNWVVQPIFDSAESYFGGLALVSISEKYGYINTSGNWIYQPTMDPEDEGGLDLGELFTDTEEETSDAETAHKFLADDFNLKKYFWNITSKVKVTSQIDSGKVDNFLKDIDGNDFRDTFNDCEFWVFYDSTFWQNGKEGFLICSDSDWIYFIINNYGTAIFTFAIDDINDSDATFITGIELSTNKVIITYSDDENEDMEYELSDLPEGLDRAIHMFYNSEIEIRKSYV